MVPSTELFVTVAHQLHVAPEDQVLQQSPAVDNAIVGDAKDLVSPLESNSVVISAEIMSYPTFSLPGLLKNHPPSYVSQRSRSKGDIDETTMEIIPDARRAIALPEHERNKTHQ